MSYVEESMQNAIKEVEMWASNWGFRISVEKNKIICFSKKNKTS